MSACWARRPAAGTAVFVLFSLICSFDGAEASSQPSPLSRVEPNDNRATAGTLSHATLTLALRAAIGRWQPEGPAGPTLVVEAFGEVGKTLTVPAPLIRVTEGTNIVASIRNDLDAPLVVNGLCTRDGSPCARLEVPPHEVREARFTSGAPGTYHYWATAIGAPIPFREMAGALVVDAANAPVEPDRVLVITEWTDLTADELRQIMNADVAVERFVAFKPRLTFVINGLSWPATERFHYDVGERVRWRVINVSSQPHPLHLHGFYFDVDSAGNGLRDSVFDDSRRKRVVTHVLPPGGTMAMTWVPERAGNWLFHCHIMHHVSLERRIRPARAASADHANHHTGDHASREHHADEESGGMAGMVLGVTVRDRAGTPSPVVETKTPRRLTLVMQAAAGRTFGLQDAGFVLNEGTEVPPDGAPQAPGPAIVLRRNEPVEITLVNRLSEATSIHWHGMERESYYDGVHGFSGLNRRLTPMIAPGERFVVRFTPPRAGTFIYHTHLHDYRQLSSGLYGPLIVTDERETFDPATDHVIVLGRTGLTAEEPSLLTDSDSVVINGQRAPRLVWKSAVRHRIRVINITPDDILTVALQAASGPVTWKPLTKDGAPVPPAESSETPASVTIAVGETYDFEIEAPEGRRSLWLDVRTPGGKWQAQGRIIIR